MFGVGIIALAARRMTCHTLEVCTLWSAFYYNYVFVLVCFCLSSDNESHAVCQPHLP